MRMHPWGLAFVAAATLAACGPAGNPGPSAELASLFQFGAYPNAEKLRESTYPGNLGPFTMPGNSGYQVYQTRDDAATVRRHYEGLARQYNWLIDPVPSPGPGHLAKLSQGRFTLNVAYSQDPTGYEGPYGYPAPIQPSPSPSGSPGPGPTPTPYPGPWFVTIQGDVQGRSY